MKKIKLTVGLLAFAGLAVLNFTQSEKTFVSKSIAATTSDVSNDGTSSSSSKLKYPYNCIEIVCHVKETESKTVSGSASGGISAIGGSGSYNHTHTTETTWDGHKDTCVRANDGKEGTVKKCSKCRSKCE